MGCFCGTSADFLIFRGLHSGNVREYSCLGEVYPRISSGKGKSGFEKWESSLFCSCNFLVD